MMQDPEGMIGENLPTVGAILLRKRGRELPQQPYRPVIMLALVYDRNFEDVPSRWELEAEQ